MNNTTLHQLEDKPEAQIKSSSKPNAKKWTSILITVLVVFVAIILGRVAAQFTVKSNGSLPQVTYTQQTGLGDKNFGQKNEKLCPDKAEGTLKPGGIDGEGTHHLVRKGGKDQYVYLTSSTVDLSKVQNKKVLVWGKTYAAQTAGWLMDVCYLEIK